MKYESNTPMYSKDIARKPFFIRDVHTGRDKCTGRTDKGDAICPPIKNSGGIKKIHDEVKENMLDMNCMRN